MTLDDHLDVIHHGRCNCEQAGDCEYCKSLIVLRKTVQWLDAKPEVEP